MLRYIVSASSAIISTSSPECYARTYKPHTLPWGTPAKTSARFLQQHQRTCLAGTRWPGGRSAHAEPHGLGGGDVDAVGERGDDQAGAVAQVLVPVREGGVAHTHAAVANLTGQGCWVGCWVRGW